MPGPGGMPTIIGVPEAAAESASRRFVTPGDRLEAIYIGHISPDVTDELLKKVLLQCGTVQRWNRSRDPKTDAPTSFGFCEFETPEAVWRVTTLLDGLELGGSKIKVSCPARTRELMEKWHNQRLFFLKQTHPNWTSEQVEEEFRQDDENARRILMKIVDDIEAQIRKNREAEETARTQRIQAMKSLQARMLEKKEPAAKRQRLTVDMAKEKKAESGIPQYIVNRQQRRVENVRNRLKELDEDYERRLAKWNEMIQALLQESSSKWARFEDSARAMIPSRRTISKLIDADLHEVRYQFAVPYLETLGRSHLYDFDGRTVLSHAPRHLDEDGIPTGSKSWQHEADDERARMRAVEKQDDADDAAAEVQEAKDWRARTERWQAVATKLAAYTAAKAVATAAAQAAEAEATKPEAAVVGERVAEVAARAEQEPPVQWEKLLQSGFFEPHGQLVRWLRQEAARLVEEKDLGEFVDYVCELLPPKCGRYPTAASLLGEMTEFLEADGPPFFERLWRLLIEGGTPAR